LHHEIEIEQEVQDERPPIFQMYSRTMNYGGWGMWAADNGIMLAAVTGGVMIMQPSSLMGAAQIGFIAGTAADLYVTGISNMDLNRTITQGVTGAAISVPAFYAARAFQ
jgi:hypothetical protein